MASAVAQIGAVGVLVCNTAVPPSAANRHLTGTVSHRDWTQAFRRMLSVNLLGVTNLMWAVANHLIEQHVPGAIVNNGSRGAFRGEPKYPAHAAIKAGLHAQGQSLAVALARHRASVTSITPGFVATRRQLAKLARDEGVSLGAPNPFDRMGSRPLSPGSRQGRSWISTVCVTTVGAEVLIMKSA